MDGSINFSGTLAGSIADSGGGGSTVTITPTLESGTKIADYSIDGDSGSLYAPTSLSANLPLSISNNVLSIDLSNYMTETEIYTFFPTTSYVNNMFQSMSRDLQENYQKKLVAGTGISIDSITNTISCTASGGGANYSTTEQDTGILWTDGRHIYQKTFVLDSAWQLTTSLKQFPFDISSLNIDFPIGCEVYFNANRGPVPYKEIRKLSNLTYMQISGIVQFNLDIGSMFTVRYVKVAT